MLILLIILMTHVCEVMKHGDTLECLQLTEEL